MVSNVTPLRPAIRRYYDSFVNLLAGLGVQGRDKMMSQTYAYTPLTQLEVELAYRGDWIARKAVEIPAFDMTRMWREWQAENDQIEKIEEVEKKLFVQQKVQQALVKSRLYGGCAIIIGVEQGAPEQELDPESVGVDGLKFLHVVPAHWLSSGPTIEDLMSPWYGLPEWYEAKSIGPGQTVKAEQVRLHPSRVVRFLGLPAPDMPLANADTWGDSILQPLNDAIKACGMVTGSLATLISELKIDVIKVPDLSDILSTDEGTNRLTARFSNANVAKSVINTILLDANEEWSRVQANLNGVPEILQSYLLIACGAADIPATRFLGRSPVGLNATGESDTRNYYDRLRSEQTSVLQPAMSILDEVIIRSALGSRPEEIFYNWTSLWQMTDKEKAELAFQKAQAFKIDADSGLIPDTALAYARINQLVEDGTYPGLEQAIDDAETEGDTIEERNKIPEPGDVGTIDPVTGKPIPPAGNGIPPRTNGPTPPQPA